MNIRNLIGAAALSALAAACAEPAMETPDTAASLRIETAEQFADLIVGRTLTYEGGSATFRSDGVLAGEEMGEPWEGVWSFQDGVMCRTIPTLNRPDDCQVWTVTGPNIDVVRQDGGGYSASITPMAIETPEQFAAHAVGKTVTYDRGEVTFGEDGTLTGVHDGNNWTGRWTFEDGAYCWVTDSGDFSDCELVTIAGLEWRSVGDRGAGEVYPPNVIR